MHYEPVAVRDPSGWIHEILDEYSGALFLFAYRALGRREDAEDVVQEILVRVWRAADQYDPDRATIRTWLFSIARNVVIDHRRRQGARPQVVADVDGHGREPHDNGAAFDRALESWQMARALRSLTVEHREVIIETYYRDRSVADAAARLGIPPGTVKSRLYHGLRKLRLALEENGVLG